MKKRFWICGASVAFCLGINGAVFGAEEPVSLPSPVVAQNDLTDNKELLMFVEEQDMVTATKRHTSLRKAPAIATIISADDIRNMGARNLLDVLKMVPGFGASTTVYGVTKIEVRGIMTDVSEKILVMIDGHSLNLNITGSAFYSFINLLPVENIKQVEVIRGPGSALYGTSAFIATINIITRNAEEINGIELKGGGGSFSTWKTNMVAGKDFGNNVTVSGSIDHYQTDGPRLTVAADALTGAPFSRAPGNPALDERQTDAFLKVGYGDLSFRGGYRTLRKGGFIGFGYALVDNNYHDMDSYWGELAYNRNITEELALSLKLRYDHFEQNPNIKIFPNGFSPVPGLVWPNGMIGRPLVKDRNFGGELQIDWDCFKNNHLIGGFSFDYTEQYDVKQLGNFNPLPLSSVQEIDNWNKDTTRNVWALYLQDEWTFSENVSLTTGVRYDHYNDFGDTFNPRVGLVWSFLENADLKLLYGQAFRAPSFQELYNINNPAQLGNPSLKPEKIVTYEAALGYRLNRHLAASLNYFYSTINKQIDIEQAASPAPTYANKSKSVIQGVELDLNGAITNELYWKANYAWQDPRDDKTGQRLPFVPSHRASGSINYAPVKYLNLHTDVLWTGPRLRPSGDTRPESPDYTVVDLAVTLKNFYSTLEIQAAVHNLFDRRFSDPDTSGKARLIPGDFPREGISAFVSASYKF